MGQQKKKKKKPQIITSISSQLPIRKVARSEKVPTSQNSATYRPPIKIKQINYQPEIFGPWALGPKGCTNQHHHHQQVAGNNNHEYPRRSHLTDISLANSWRRDVKKTYNIFTIISPPYKLPTLMDLI